MSRESVALPLKSIAKSADIRVWTIRNDEQNFGN